eukprot:GHVL01002876.1.p1 GENE.GHVL01002876.1~~GHVL01002876.1.p1  ORF type:complete len:215 (+),score=42.98 GHVL01002876.1:766-1410(+)
MNELFKLTNEKIQVILKKRLTSIIIKEQEEDKDEEKEEAKPPSGNTQKLIGHFERFKTIKQEKTTEQEDLDDEWLLPLRHIEQSGKRDFKFTDFDNKIQTLKWNIDSLRHNEGTAPLIRTMELMHERLTRVTTIFDLLDSFGNDVKNNKPILPLIPTWRAGRPLFEKALEEPPPKTVLKEDIELSSITNKKKEMGSPFIAKNHEKRHGIAIDLK